MFDAEVRVLACDRCGAPLEGSAEVLEIACRYCGARNHIDRVEALPPLPAITPREQGQRLAAQVGRVRVPHPAVAEFMDGDRLAPWREREALAAWLQARKAPTGGEDASRLFELTRLLAAAAQRAGDGLRERSLLETGYQSCAIPRHRTYFAAKLAQGAVLASDARSAQTWISRCDSAVDDLEAFSAMQIAKALAAWLDGRADLVLSILGVPGHQTAVYLPDEAIAAVLCADALERTVQHDAALTALDSLVLRRWPRSRAELHIAHRALGGRLCPVAIQRLAEFRGRTNRSKNLYNLAVILAFTGLWGGLGAWSLFQVTQGELGWTAGVVVGFVACAFLIWGAFYTLRNWNAWHNPFWGTVQSISSPIAAGRYLDPASESGTARVALDEDATKIWLVGYRSGEVVHPGMRALFVRKSDQVDWLA
jgi:hypothetical protein